MLKIFFFYIINFLLKINLNFYKNSKGAFVNFCLIDDSLFWTTFDTKIKISSGLRFEIIESLTNLSTKSFSVSHFFERNIKFYFSIFKIRQVKNKITC